MKISSKMESVVGKQRLFGIVLFDQITVQEVPKQIFLSHVFIQILYIIILV